MSPKKAPKPFKNYSEQLAILKDRGLVVLDEKFALHCLEHHNYYRLSAYRFPLTVVGNPDEFLSGTTFEQLWNLYCFDRDLRLIVMEAVKRLEISVRAHWGYVLGEKYGPQAYENPNVFFNTYRHTEALADLDKEIQRSHELFIPHFQNNYGMSRPPIWAACEVMNFNLLSRLYENIKRDKERKTIAGVFSFSVQMMTSLLRHSVHIRNICAHHSRLWNRRFTVTVSLPKWPATVVASLNPSQDRRIYNSLVLLAHIVNIVEPENNWTSRLIELLDSQDFPVTKHMGFPDDWQDFPIWKN